MIYKFVRFYSFYKQNEQDFDLIFKYYDPSQNSTRYETIECDHTWEITKQNEQYPEEITVYDKGYDERTNIDFENIIIWLFVANKNRYLPHGYRSQVYFGINNLK